MTTYDINRIIYTLKMFFYDWYLRFLNTLNLEKNLSFDKWFIYSLTLLFHLILSDWFN